MSLPQSLAQPAEALDDALVLTVIAGPLSGQTHRLEGHSTFLIGSRPAGVQLSIRGDPYISGTHCLIEVNPPLARLVDLRSKNGTFLNGERVGEAVLRHGDRITVGTTTLLVEFPGDLSQQTADGPVATDARTDPLLPGYVVLREAGRGGMGIVYQARRLADEQFVAVKAVLPAVHPRPETLGRFKREMAILERLSHPHIVRFLETGESSGMLCFIMEWVEGESGSDAVKRAGPFSPERIVALGCQLLEALAHAHLQGFIHRDVKPGNVLLTTITGRETLKLADFGLARTYQASAMSGLTICGQPGGTLGYMPPEQALDFRSAKPTADQYSAAATLYYLFTGKMIYEASQAPAEMLARILTEEPLPLRQPPTGPPLPGQLGPVLCRALARDPQKRYPDVLAFRDALSRAL
jgi:serine/threonine-protein kinase